MCPVDYANPLHLIVDVPPYTSVPTATPAVPRESAVLVMTKDHTDRLPTTLPKVSSLPCPVVLIDDSTSTESRARGRRLAQRLGVIYHGREAQAALLGKVDNALAQGFVGRLGTPGWTLGLCRNYSLLLAAASGYEQFVLMDDDITLPSNDLLARTLNLAREFDFVGARTVGLADDSVVGHIARRLGVQQYDFVTGQYLGVRARLQPSCFPNEYNEDLIFLLLGAGPRRIARYGTVRQLHQGVRTLGIERALSQEVGEVHCEGCIQATMEGRHDSLTDPGFWSRILAFRWECLADLVARDQEYGGSVFTPILDRVLDRSRGLTAQLFASFYRSYFEKLPRWKELQAAVAH